MNVPALPPWLQVRTEAPPVPSAESRFHKREAFGHKTLRGLTSARAAAVTVAQLTQKHGWLQGVGARVKIPGLAMLLLAVSLMRNPGSLLLVCAMVWSTSFAAKIPGRLFLKRIWLLPAVFAGPIILPALCNWVRPGTPLLTIWRGTAPFRLGPLAFPPTLALTREGGRLVLGLFLRVMASAGLAGLVTLTTPWPEALQALRAFHLPRIFLAALEMSQRYLHMFLRTAQDYFLARESRSISRAGGRAGRRFTGAVAGALFLKACHAGEQVHQAMISRGYRGEPAAAPLPRWRTKDLLQVALILILALSLMGSDALLAR